MKRLTKERETEIRAWVDDGEIAQIACRHSMSELLAELDAVRAELRGKPPVNVKASETIPKLFDEIDQLRAANAQLTKEKNWACEAMEANARLVGHLRDAHRDEFLENATLEARVNLYGEALKIATDALDKAQEGLDLAHTCGLPPVDISGRDMWSDSQKIRMQTRESLTELRRLGVMGD